MKIEVNIERKSSAYAIDIVASGAIAFIEAKHTQGAFIVVDANVSDIYKISGERVLRFEASEKNKTLSSVEAILCFLKDGGALRGSELIAVGGGITGDTVGFAASMYMRGIKFSQVPTTLLAMVDSSVGGKTGVNLGGIKNNIGAFHQPTEVLIDVTFLDTLSDAEFLNGFAESIKIAAVLDADFFHKISADKDVILERNKDVLQDIIYQSCLLKKNVVEEDEKESGVRKLLNFGHTIAHAIETDSHHCVPHGFAVAMGMAYETQFALRNGYADEATYKLIIDILKSFGYATSYKPKSIDTFRAALMKDKKASKSGISIALTASGLQGKIIDGVEPERLVELFY